MTSRHRFPSLTGRRIPRGAAVGAALAAGGIGTAVGAGAAVVARLISGPQRPVLDAVVVDSPFARMRDVVATALRRFRVPVWPTLAASDRATRLLYGYRYEAVRPIFAVAAIAPRPLLILHGAKDRIIPVQQARDLFAAAGEPKQLLIFPDADHCGGYFADRPGYIALVNDFFDHAFHGVRTTS